MLGEASERRFACNLCYGPPKDHGFFYDMRLPGGTAVQQSDWAAIEVLVGKISKGKHPFERLEMSKDDLRKMFKDNPYKLHYIDNIPEATATVYRDGPFIDLCRGPHIQHTGRVEAFAVTLNAAAYWLSDKENDSLQRIWGISFPEKKQLAEYRKWKEEAALRDHRKVGQDQELFFFHELSPGSAMWLPHGTRIFNNVVTLIKDEYWKRGYQEVVSPNMYNSKLWKQSGHWDHYQDNMFTFNVEKEQFALKPMNCPGHCLMFGNRIRSYRELPLRLADFGVLHRNEASGALSGLTRVRRLQQDGAHIFCREDQIGAEIEGILDLIRTVYSLLGLTFKMRLSTRPDKYMGQLETWDLAEKHLVEALDRFAVSPGGEPWEMNEGDGAFYGPKIDIAISDCLGREWQCATIQLDFQGPQNFGLEYMASEESEAKRSEDISGEAVPQTTPVDDDGTTSTRKIKPLTTGCKRPVMIHRAVVGSVERFTGILMEHFAGKWPFWLSPRQILIVPVGVKYNSYAKEVEAIFHDQHMHVDVDVSGNTLKDKIRTGQLAKYNFIFVVCDEEMKNRTVNVRNRDDTTTQNRGDTVRIEEAIQKLAILQNSQTNSNPFVPLLPAEKRDMLKARRAALEAEEKALIAKKRDLEAEEEAIDSLDG
ncbi:threonyl-tRNA synthetase [Phlyctema vagabunda]|uniref:threonine--tRNA ligase n=1 Tax=Phlyctema vagabunda TaxID=108571 RepID=A0ABR4P7I3_9HELO